MKDDVLAAEAQARTLSLGKEQGESKYFCLPALDFICLML